MKYSIFVTP